MTALIVFMIVGSTLLALGIRAARPNAVARYGRQPNTLNGDGRRIAAPVNAFGSQATSAGSAGSGRSFDYPREPTPKVTATRSERPIGAALGRKTGRFEGPDGAEPGNKHLEEQLIAKTLLLREIHHRMKNNMGTVSGMLSIQAENVSDPQARSALLAAISRVQSMGILYEQLMLTDDCRKASVKRYIEDLVWSLLALFSPTHSPIIRMRVSDFDLESDTLTTVGIIMNELLTNMLKYSFPDAAGGIGEISLSKVGSHVTLCIQDNGRGLPDGFDISDSTGLGLTLVGLLADQLGARFRIESNQGTRSTLEFDI